MGLFHRRRRAAAPGQRRSGFRFFGPVPGYSTTTRRGTRVHAGGCCLPIPLTVLVGAVGAVGVWRRGATGSG